MDKEDLFKYIEDVLVDRFEVDRDIISMDAHLSRDLDIDSIDAVDLLVFLNEKTGKKISPDQFKKVVTLGDVVNAIAAL